MSESFSTQTLQAIIPAYIYEQYRDDENIVAFATSFNQLAQSYLDWFNNTPLAVYTSSYITGLLLDWTATGIYDIARPTLSTSSSYNLAGYGTGVYGITPPYGELQHGNSGTAVVATDDIYKRVLTWHLYRGDGQKFSTQWLKNRVARFLNGINGSDYAVLNVQISVKIYGADYVIYIPASNSTSAYFEQALNNGVLALPFQYSFSTSLVGTLSNVSGVVHVSGGYPTSASGLNPGDLWSNSGVVTVVSGITPNASAPLIYFSQTNAIELIGLGGGNLPLTAGTTGSGSLWNNSGVVTVS